MAPRTASRHQKSARKKSSRASHAPLRFAHPFFTTGAPPAAAPATTRAAGARPKRMLDHIQAKLQRIPAPRRKAKWKLADLIGAASAAAIEQSGKMQFHSVGDTGRKADSPQGHVAEAMTQDFDVNQPAKSPAFFLHLGDVIYGPNKTQHYRPQFYEPYMHYPGKIIAIAGNHDGEVFPTSDPHTLTAFLANFCAARAVVPPIAGTIYRETMTQPGVYWLLDAPFVQIVGLYSNAAENPGFLSGGAAGTGQRTWLLKTLKKIAAERAGGSHKGLVFATHHPPFTSGGHSPSSAMLAEVDGLCTQAGVMPDLWISGHAHSYQRYTRFVTLQGAALEIPHIVAGTGGISDQAIAAATGQRTGDRTFESSRKGYGYLLLTAELGRITAKFVAVDMDTLVRSDFDSVTVDTATHKVV